MKKDMFDTLNSIMDDTGMTEDQKGAVRHAFVLYGQDRYADGTLMRSPNGGWEPPIIEDASKMRLCDQKDVDRLVRIEKAYKDLTDKANEMANLMKDALSGLEPVNIETMSMDDFVKREDAKASQVFRQVNFPDANQIAQRLNKF